MTSKETITWNDCDVVTATFSTIDEHELKCDVLFPPKLKPGRHPLIITYHGGYLISGARNFYQFLPAWLPEYAASVSAVIISPDYRLFPSATPAEVRDDVEALWMWVKSSLTTFLSSHAPEHQLDLNNVLLEGSSAGGFCAAHLTMNHTNEIRAAILVYPMLYNTSDYISRGPPNSPELIAKLDLWEGNELDKKIEEQKSGWVSNRTGQDDLKLTVSIMKGGRFGQLFGDKQHDPIDRVRRGDGQGLPPTWIIHGRADSGVPARGSEEFVEEVKRSAWKSGIRLDVIEDEPSEHGFDRTWTLGHEKLDRGLEWIGKAWPSV